MHVSLFESLLEPGEGVVSISEARVYERVRVRRQALQRDRVWSYGECRMCSDALDSTPGQGTTQYRARSSRP